MAPDHLSVFFDGSCWPNPGGQAAIGYVVRKGSETLDREHRVLGTGPDMSNNVAEFSALHAGLAFYADLAIAGDTVTCFGDSMLVINIMAGKWRAKGEKLYTPYYHKCAGLVRTIRARGVTVLFSWIPREENTECDNLSKAHLTGGFNLL